MPASSSLVSIGEDAEVRLVSLLSETANLPVSFAQDCERSIQNADVAQLVRTIVSQPEAVSSFGVMEPLEEAVAALSLLVALAARVNVALDPVKVCARGDVSRQLTLLSVLYNMESDSAQKLAFLTKMYALAEPSMLGPDSTLGAWCEQLPSLLDSWKIPLADRRSLYRTIAEKTDSQRVRLWWVTTGDPDAAVPAVLGALRDPFAHFQDQRSLLATVPSLQQSDPALYKLLQVVQQGTLADLDALPKPLPHGLDEAQCRRHVGILHLCALAAEQPELPYAAIQKALSLKSVQEVESWVIAAVGSGLLEAKMDQLHQTVLVERCAYRQLDLKQWKALQTRLASWKQHVGRVLETLQEQQATATVATK